MADEAAPSKPQAPAKAEAPKPRCGLVMPISAIDNYTAAHWEHVRNIISEAVADAGFEAELVSAANEVSIIQAAIIQNLYLNPIVICDVSGKNPNVMFELGLRVAFDKPAVIIKDDRTAYSFDTAPIEHLEYPSDLNYPPIVAFKKDLAAKVQATHEKATNAAYSPFLKYFGTFTIAKLDKKEVSESEFIVAELSKLTSSIRALEQNQVSSSTLIELLRASYATAINSGGLGLGFGGKGMSGNPIGLGASAGTGLFSTEEHPGRTMAITPTNLTKK
jgi:hypothetical protein